jgi:hypothetical protein
VPCFLRHTEISLRIRYYCHFHPRTCKNLKTCLNKNQHNLSSSVPLGSIWMISNRRAHKIQYVFIVSVTACQTEIFLLYFSTIRCYQACINKFLAKENSNYALPLFYFDPNIFEYYVYRKIPVRFRGCVTAFVYWQITSKSEQILTFHKEVVRSL